MKKMKKLEKNESVNKDCCVSTVDNVREESCCAQPDDGSECCDKGQSKQYNSKKIGCC